MKRPSQRKTGVAGGEGPSTLETRAEMLLQQMLTLQLCVLDNSPTNDLRYSKVKSQELAQVRAQGAKAGNGHIWVALVGM